MRERIILLFLLIIATAGCGTSAKIEEIRTSQKSGEVAVNGDTAPEFTTEVASLESEPDTLTVTGLNGEKLYLMRSAVDSAGNTFATETLSGVVVSARFKNIAERGGEIDLDFDIIVPKELQDPSWQIRFIPKLSISGDTISLDEIRITGAEYRSSQLRGYELYSRYLSSIITDSTELRHQNLIESFIERNFPDLAPLKRDSAYVEDNLSGLYGISYREVLNHYRKKWKIWKNDTKSAGAADAYTKFVKDPITKEGIRLDTVIRECHDITYTYRETIMTRPHLKKIEIHLDGEIVKGGETLYTIPEGSPISFYVSDLTAFAEDTENLVPGNGYSEGVAALRERDYKRAIELLSPYRDMNSAIALMSLGYDAPAREILESLPKSAKRDYILAIIYAHEGDEKGAVESFMHSVERDRSFRFRANLDPEISALVNKYSISFSN